MDAMFQVQGPGAWIWLYINKQDLEKAVESLRRQRETGDMSPSSTAVRPFPDTITTHHLTSEHCYRYSD